MFISDLIYVLIWWGMLLGITLTFLPLTSHVFRNFFDKGYIFSKFLGVACISYLVFLVGILHLVPFTFITVLVTIFLTAAVIFFFFGKSFLQVLKTRLIAIIIFEEALFLFILLFWTYIRSFFPDIHGLEKYMDLGFINAILRSDYFPPKDMWLTPYTINYYYFGHLVTALLTKLSTLPSAITYNLMLATIVGACFTTAFSIGANLFAFITNNESKGKILCAGLLTAFLLTFSGNLHTVYTFFKPYENEKPVPFWKLELSILNPCFQQKTYQEIPEHGIATDVPCSEDLQKKLFAFPNAYWYPNATRFIFNTIHEFPMYSWVVADLHGHVLDIPFVLLTIGVLLSLFINSQVPVNKTQTIVKKTKPKNHQLWVTNWKLFTVFNFSILPALRGGNLLLISLLLAVMYMTNAWDGLIYLLLATGVLFLISLITNLRTTVIQTAFPQTLLQTGIASLVVFVCFMLFSLPFSLHFKPFVSGVGIVSAPSFLLKKDSSVADQYDRRFFLKKLVVPSHCVSNMSEADKKLVSVSYLETKIGPFLLEPDHCQRSPLWQLGILYGFFAFFAGTLLLFILRYNSSKPLFTTVAKKSSMQLVIGEWRIFVSDLFVLLLIVLGALLIIIPEFIYVKDIYPAHYRANTMFKLVFQSFMLLSIVSAYTIIRILTTIPFQKDHRKQNVLLAGFVGLTLVLLSLVFLYPFFSTSAYYNNLQNYQGIDGTKYLQTLYPDDYTAIAWINKNISGQPVILESQGDSYTDHGRISVHTGFPTILGWAVHEWLWRGEYDLPPDEKKDYHPDKIVQYPAPRLSEISSLYESKDEREVVRLIKKYNIEYMYVGRLEREKYPNLTEEIFKRIGKVVYKSGEVVIYKI